MAKHSERRGDRKIIQLKDHLSQREAPPQEPETDQAPDQEAPEEEGVQASIEYDGEEKKKQARQVPKAFYRVVLVLLVLIVGLALWVNRDNLTPESIWSWLQVQVTGDGEGDGYPAAITGSTVSEGNFLSVSGNAVALSDTSLTILGPSGQELLSQRHSLSQPILKSASDSYLLYNQNSTGYMVVSGTQLRLEASTEQDILAGAIASNGRFALATRGVNGASDLTVYLATGEVQFTYSFAQDYITALALNGDGTWAMVCTARSQGGQLISKVTVFDLNSTTPAAEYESQDNLLLGAGWGDNGVLYAVGDASLLRASFPSRSTAIRAARPRPFSSRGDSAICPSPPMSMRGPPRCWCSGARRTPWKSRRSSALCPCPCTAALWELWSASSWWCTTPPPARSWPARTPGTTPKALPCSAKAAPMCWVSAKSAACSCESAKRKEAAFWAVSFALSRGIVRGEAPGRGSSFGCCISGKSAAAPGGQIPRWQQAPPGEPLTR